MIQCYIQYYVTQAVLRRWKALGLTAAPRKVLGLTMALPLAPVNAFEEGLQIIQEEADLISTNYPAVLQFTVYLRRIWLPLKEKISVYGTPIRTILWKVSITYFFIDLVELILIFGNFFVRIVYSIATNCNLYIV